MEKSQLQSNLELIGEKEPEMLKAVEELVQQIAGTYLDKYEGGKHILDTKQQLYDAEVS